MDTNTAIRLRALRAVMSPDRDYLIRTILRWYSKTFFTPLREVEDLPLEDVLRAYYEEQYAAMSDDERDRVRIDLLTTDEQRYTQIVAEEAEEADMFEVRRVLEAEERAKARAAEEKSRKDRIADVKHQANEQIMPIKARESDLPSLPKTLPPAITMTFVDEAEFEKELDGFGAMVQPEKAKP